MIQAVLKAKKVVQHHINKKIYAASAMFPLFCPTLVYVGSKSTTEKILECVTLNGVQECTINMNSH
jgi:predicted RNA-binding protein